MQPTSPNQDFSTIRKVFEQISALGASQIPIRDSLSAHDGSVNPGARPLIVERFLAEQMPAAISRSSAFTYPNAQLVAPSFCRVVVCATRLHDQTTALITESSFRSCATRLHSSSTAPTARLPGLHKKLPFLPRLLISTRLLGNSPVMSRMITNGISRRFEHRASPWPFSAYD